MMETTKIKSFSRVIPMIYAYNAPGVTYLDGWTKIGYTEKQTVSDRIKQQTHTAGIRPVLPVGFGRIICVSIIRQKTTIA